MQRSSKQSDSPSTETRRSTRRTATGRSSFSKIHKIPKQTIMQFVLLFIILLLSISVFVLLKSNGTGSTIEQELAKEGYIYDLMRNIKQTYPENDPSSLFTITRFNAERISVLVTNTKKLNIKVKCSAIDLSENVTSSNVWSASNTTSVILTVPTTKPTDKSTNPENILKTDETHSMTILELDYPLNHSFVYCSAIDPEVPPQLLSSIEAPLYKLNTIPLRLYLPIERNSLGLILFSHSLKHSNQKEEDELPEVPEVSGTHEKDIQEDSEEDKETKIIEEKESEVELENDSNKEFIIKLLKRKYVSSSCSIFYTEDYFNNEQQQSDTPELNMDFSSYYLERMNKEQHIYKRLFSFSTIVDSWKINIFNKTLTEGDSTDGLDNAILPLQELKRNFYKHKEFIEITGKFNLHENTTKLHYLYNSVRSIKISCALYTGAKELKEQNLPPMEPLNELFSFSNKNNAVNCAEHTDNIKRVMCTFYNNSPIFNKWYDESLFKYTVEDKEETLSEETANKLALFSKYVHFIALDGSVKEFDSVIRSISEIEAGDSIVAYENHNKLNDVLEITMFIAETVNRMKSPMSNTHSSMKIIKFDKMYTVLKNSIKLLKMILEINDVEKLSEVKKDIKEMIGKSKKYIEL